MCIKFETFLGKWELRTGCIIAAFLGVFYSTMLSIYFWFGPYSAFVKAGSAEILVIVLTVYNTLVALVALCYVYALFKEVSWPINLFKQAWTYLTISVPAIWVGEFVVAAVIFKMCMASISIFLTVIFLAVLEKSCFSLELRVGCIIIAIFDFIQALSNLAIAVPDFPMTMPPQFVCLIEYWTVARIVFGVFAILLIICAIMLIIAVTQEVAALVFPWLGVFTLHLLFIVGVTILSAVSASEYHLLIGVPFKLLIDIYCIFVVLSWYSENA